MTISRFNSILVVLLLSLHTPVTFAGISPKNHTPLDRIVATVNHQAITESELEQQTALLLSRLQHSGTPAPELKELRAQLLDKMILEKLQLELAEKQELIIDDNELATAIESIATRDNLSVAELQKYLEEQGIPFKQFQKNIRTEMLLSKVQQKAIGPEVHISNKEIERFMNSPASADQSETEYRLGHILIPIPEGSSEAEKKHIEQQALETVKELHAGANFAEVAIKKSGGQQAESGGDLGLRTLDAIPTLFLKFVPQLKLNEIYGPISDEGGFYIIKLLEKKQNKTTPEQARQRALEILYQTKFEDLLATWLKRLRADADVTVTLNAI